MRATINYDYLRPLKANNLKERHESKFEKKDELSVWSGKNATILPLRSDPKGTMLFGKGGVVDENGEYVDISAIDGRVQGKYDVLNPLYKDEKVV
ncbi:MAG: hypothetical protein J6V36_04345 [Clostridia bacterium]|nr:hypothetical protein [Clostridia bacterium]